MSSEYANFLFEQLDKLTDKNVMIIEYCDNLGWHINRKLYKNRNNFSIIFMNSNGNTFTRTYNKEQIMNFIIVNNIKNAFIIDK